MRQNPNYLACFMILCVTSGIAEAQPVRQKFMTGAFLTSNVIKKPVRSLRDMITEKLSSDKFEEVPIGADIDKFKSCLQTFNGENPAENCSIQIARDKGAELVMCSEIDGDSESCGVTVRLILVAKRKVYRQYFAALEPCDVRDLILMTDRAAAYLNDKPVPEPSTQSFASAPEPAPATVTLSAGQTDLTWQAFDDNETKFLNIILWNVTQTMRPGIYFFPPTQETPNVKFEVIENKDTKEKLITAYYRRGLSDEQLRYARGEAVRWMRTQKR